jgi:hypothetical protein
VLLHTHTGCGATKGLWTLVLLLWIHLLILEMLLLLSDSVTSVRAHLKLILVQKLILLLLHRVWGTHIRHLTGCTSLHSTHSTHIILHSTTHSLHTAHIQVHGGGRIHVHHSAGIGIAGGWWSCTIGVLVRICHSLQKA